MKIKKIRINTLALIKNGDKLLGLLGHDQPKSEDFIRLIGGGVNFGETSIDGLRREFREELGSEIDNLKLLDTIENIFTYNDSPSHEITFLYSAEIEQKFLIEEKFQIFDSLEEKYAEWFPVDEIRSKNIKVYPEQTLKYLS